MKRSFLLSISFVFLSMVSFAQVDTVRPGDPALVTPAVPVDTAWKVGGHFGLQFNQSAYSNWQAGGVNSVAGNALFHIFANYDNGGRWSWYNTLTLAYGLAFQDTISNKTDDRIQLESRVDRRISENWSASALLNFRTQFTNGYNPPSNSEDTSKVSAFLAPAYTLLGLGLTYKPDEKFSAFLSPVTAKFTIVNDDSLAAIGAYGVTPGEKTRYEVGGYVNLTYQTPLFTNVDLKAKLDLYSNYLNDQYKFIDVNGELIIFMKVNKFITANVTFNVIYDNDILFDTNGDGVLDGPRTQFREVLGIGLSYDFGYKMK